MTTGTIIGRRLVWAATKRPAARRTWRWSVLDVGGVVLERLLDGVAHRLGALVEQVLGLGGVDPAPGDDLGAGDDGAGR